MVSSPPYEDMAGKARHDGSPIVADNPKMTFHYANEQNHINIGNLKNAAYWESMRLVYQECHRVLKPQGIMVLVLKGFTRDGKYVDLPAQTQALVESLGFTKFDEWTRELWSLSFWRILQQRRDPAAFDERLKFEYVLAFRKDGEQGNGVDATVFSPPYEGSEVAQSSDSEANRRFRDGAYAGDALKGMGLSKGYTRPSKEMQ